MKSVVNAAQNLAMMHALEQHNVLITHHALKASIMHRSYVGIILKEYLVMAPTVKMFN